MNHINVFKIKLLFVIVFFDFEFSSFFTMDSVLFVFIAKVEKYMSGLHPNSSIWYGVHWLFVVIATSCEIMEKYGSMYCGYLGTLLVLLKLATATSTYQQLFLSKLCLQCFAPVSQQGKREMTCSGNYLWRRLIMRFYADDPLLQRNPEQWIITPAFNQRCPTIPRTIQLVR